jgi:hypothetical protein
VRGTDIERARHARGTQSRGLRAYLERGGAYFNLRKIDLARADAVKACDLGVSEACARAKALGP